MANVGKVFGNLAVAGMPGRLNAVPAAPPSWAAVRPTDRRVSPRRSSFRRFVENTCW